MQEIKFKNITLEDQVLIEFYLQKYSSFCLSAFTFSSLISWAPVYHYQWAVFSNTLLIKLKTLEDNNEHLMQPLGEFPIELQTILIQHATSLNYRLTIYGVSSVFISKHQEFLCIPPSKYIFPFS